MPKKVTKSSRKSARRDPLSTAGRSVPETTFNCPWMGHEVTGIPNDMPNNTACCDECFVDFIKPRFEAALVDENEYPVKVEGHELNIKQYAKHFTKSFVRAFLEKEKEYKIRYRARVYCAGTVAKPKSCGKFLGGSRHRRTRPCPDCRCFTCNRCKKLIEKDPADHWKTCEPEKEEGFGDLVRGVHYQICPHCDKKVERRDGCNHMTCTCPPATQFCFVCGKPATEYSGHWTFPNPCPRFPIVEGHARVEVEEGLPVLGTGEQLAELLAVATQSAFERSLIESELLIGEMARILGPEDFDRDHALAMVEQAVQQGLTARQEAIDEHARILRVLEAQIIDDIAANVTEDDVHDWTQRRRFYRHELARWQRETDDYEAGLPCGTDTPSWLENARATILLASIALGFIGINETFPTDSWQRRWARNNLRNAGANAFVFAQNMGPEGAARWPELWRMTHFIRELPTLPPSIPPGQLDEFAMGREDYDRERRTDASFLGRADWQLSEDDWDQIHFEVFGRRRV